MFNKSDYLEDYQRTALISATQRVREIVRYVVENKDAFEEELKMLTRLNKENPTRYSLLRLTISLMDVIALRLSTHGIMSEYNYG